MKITRFSSYSTALLRMYTICELNRMFLPFKILAHPCSVPHYEGNNFLLSTRARHTDTVKNNHVIFKFYSCLFT